MSNIADWQRQVGFDSAMTLSDPKENSARMTIRSGKLKSGAQLLVYKWNKLYEAAIYETNALRIGARIAVADGVLHDRISKLHGPADQPERDEAVKCSGKLAALKARVCPD